MKIDMNNATIKFGTGNFSVTEQGHITAKGGGSIAGLKISNNSLYSVNEKIYLHSNGAGAI
jgi:hypothetical protein